MGETLPVGTQEGILAWIKARYKVLGEIFVVGSENLGPRFIFSLRSPLFSDETFFPCQQTVRYLVEVEGVERMFVLRPVPDALLVINARGVEKVGESEKRREDECGIILNKEERPWQRSWRKSLTSVRKATQCVANLRRTGRWVRLVIKHLAEVRYDT